MTSKTQHATEILYDDGTLETLLDSEPGLVEARVGSRAVMSKAAQCASTGWYTVVETRPMTDAERVQVRS